MAFTCSGSPGQGERRVAAHPARGKKQEPQKVLRLFRLCREEMPRGSQVRFCSFPAPLWAGL